MAIFVLAVEAGSFSGAARQLGSTPSAISRSVARLEDAMSTKLLHRTTRKLSLSDAGAEVLKHCREMLDSANAALQLSGKGDEEPSGRLKVSAPRGIGRFLIHPHIPDFLRRYPNVDVELILEDRSFDLYDGTVDLAFQMKDEPPRSLMGRRFFRIEHILCASTTYLKERGRPAHPKDLQNHSCITLSSAPEDTRWKFYNGGSTVTVDVGGRYTVNHTGIRLEAVLGGLGIGSIPYFTAREALLNGSVEQVLPEWSFKANFHGDVWLLYPPTRYLPLKARCFIDFIAGRLLEMQQLFQSPSQAGKKATFLARTLLTDMLLDQE